MLAGDFHSTVDKVEKPGDSLAPCWWAAVWAISPSPSVKKLHVKKTVTVVCVTLIVQAFSGCRCEDPKIT